MERIKGFDVLLRGLAAAKLQRPWQLVLAGDGPDRPRLERLTQELGLAEQVQFSGRIPSEELVVRLGQADLVLNPDQGQPAFGLTLAEALLMGVPVLASRVGAHREVLGRGDGLLVPPGEVKAWARALERAAASLPETPEKRHRRMLRARQRFDRQLMIQRLLAVYRKLLE